MANIYEARRQLTAAGGNIDTNVASITALSVANTFCSIPAAVPVYTRPGRHLITPDS